VGFNLSATNKQTQPFQVDIWSKYKLKVHLKLSKQYRLLVLLLTAVVQSITWLIWKHVADEQWQSVFFATFDTQAEAMQGITFQLDNT
jgi:hypothetical protein